MVMTERIMGLLAIGTLVSLGLIVYTVASPSEAVTVNYLEGAIVVLVGVAVVAGLAGAARP